MRQQPLPEDDIRFESEVLFRYWTADREMGSVAATVSGFRQRGGERTCAGNGRSVSAECKC